MQDSEQTKSKTYVKEATSLLDLKGVETLFKPEMCAYF